MPTRRLAIAVVLAIALGFALGSCSSGLCGRNSDCAVGEVCTTVGQCAVPPADAGADETTDGSGSTVIDNAREREVPGLAEPRDLDQGALDG
jgi:hypothetical protein